jgi:hypothetical protein
MTIEQIENEILKLIDLADELTRSDLQGMVSALAMNIVREVKQAK